MKAKDYIEKEVLVLSRKWKGDNLVVTDQVLLHRAKVLYVEERSRTMVQVEDIDRGPGWSEEKRRYIGVRTKRGWFRGENKEFGNKGTYKVHISQLQLLN